MEAKAEAGCYSLVTSGRVAGGSEGPTHSAPLVGRNAVPERREPHINRREADSGTKCLGGARCLIKLELRSVNAEQGNSVFLRVLLNEPESRHSTPTPMWVATEDDGRMQQGSAAVLAASHPQVG